MNGPDISQWGIPQNNTLPRASVEFERILGVKLV